LSEVTEEPQPLNQFLVRWRRQLCYIVQYLKYIGILPKHSSTLSGLHETKISAPASNPTAHHE
jgi:hypothetical protein